MNQWISSLFGQLLGFLHFLMLLGIATFWFYLANKTYDPVMPTLASFGLFIAYLITFGTISTIVSANNTLLRIEELLTRNQNSVRSSSPPSLSAQRSIDDFNRGAF